MNKIRPLIAVVEDEESVRAALMSLLYAANLDVEMFPSVAEFLGSLKMGHPDCVVLDVRKPMINGFLVEAWLKQAGIRLPVVVINGQGASETREGAPAYLLMAGSECQGAASFIFTPRSIESQRRARPAI